MTYKELTPQERRVIIDKGTEQPFSGKYNDLDRPGTYICKRCGAELYKSTDKFKSGCGWPSFDDEIPGAVTKTPDADRVRTEIVCANCDAHLGHIFTGEGFTQKNTRHCVNSISLEFIPAQSGDKTEKTYFAGGCFWGVEYWLSRQDGVVSVTSGYMGGSKENPTYREVCSGTTGHAEAVEVTYQPNQIAFEDLAKVFFEIHDPTQLNRQGPDIGEQYRSEVFYTDDRQKQITEKLIAELRENGYDVKTQLEPAGKFWPAEDYHQNYYAKTGKTPYCHQPQKRFS